jgi:hypothetical protein
MPSRARSPIGKLKGSRATVSRERKMRCFLSRMRNSSGWPVMVSEGPRKR